MGCYRQSSQRTGGTGTPLDAWKHLLLRFIPSVRGLRGRCLAVLRRGRLTALCGEVWLLAKGEHDVVSRELATHPTTEPAMLSASLPVGRVSLFCPSSRTTLEICKRRIT